MAAPGQLIAIPLGIAGWLRYMMGIDDQGNPYTLAPDPLAGEMTEILKDIEIGKPETLKDQLKPVLSNETIFFTNLYENGVGNKIEELFREMIAGKGAVRAVIDNTCNCKQRKQPITVTVIIMAVIYLILSYLF